MSTVLNTYSISASGVLTIDVSLTAGAGYKINRYWVLCNGIYADECVPTYERWSGSQLTMTTARRISTIDLSFFPAGNLTFTYQAEYKNTTTNALVTDAAGSISVTNTWQYVKPENSPNPFPLYPVAVPDAVPVDPPIGFVTQPFVAEIISGGWIISYGTGALQQETLSCVGRILASESDALTRSEICTITVAVAPSVTDSQPYVETGQVALYCGVSAANTHLMTTTGTVGVIVAAFSLDKAACIEHRTATAVTALQILDGIEFWEDLLCPLLPTIWASTTQEAVDSTVLWARIGVSLADSIETAEIQTAASFISLWVFDEQTADDEEIVSGAVDAGLAVLDSLDSSELVQLTAFASGRSLDYATVLESVPILAFILVSDVDDWYKVADTPYIGTVSPLRLSSIETARVPLKDNSVQRVILS